MLMKSQKWVFLDFWNCRLTLTNFKLFMKSWIWVLLEGRLGQPSPTTHCSWKKNKIRNKKKNYKQELIESWSKLQIKKKKIIKLKKRSFSSFLLTKAFYNVLVGPFIHGVWQVSFGWNFMYMVSSSIKIWILKSFKSLLFTTCYLRVILCPNSISLYIIFIISGQFLLSICWKSQQLNFKT